MRRAFWAAFWLLCGSLPVGAANISLSVVQETSDLLPGVVINDFKLDFDDALRGQQILCELCRGSVIYQHPLGGDTPPQEASVATAPELAFDSFITVGGETIESSFPILDFGGGAVNLGGSRFKQFDDQVINITWAPGAGVNIPSGSDFLTARITLSNNAQGRIKYLGSTSNRVEVIWDLSVENGIVFGGFGSPPPDGPVVGCDAFIDRLMAGAEAIHQFVASDVQSPQEELLWELVEFSAMPGFGGPGIPGPFAPMLSDTGLFEWNSSGSTLGSYTATVKVTDPDGFHTTTALTINVEQAVPEPAAVQLLVMMAFVASGFGCRSKARRRNPVLVDAGLCPTALM